MLVFTGNTQSQSCNLKRYKFDEHQAESKAECLCRFKITYNSVALIITIL